MVLCKCSSGDGWTTSSAECSQCSTFISLASAGEIHAEAFSTRAGKVDQTVQSFFSGTNWGRRGMVTAAGPMMTSCGGAPAFVSCAPPSFSSFAVQQKSTRLAAPHLSLRQRTAQQNQGLQVGLCRRIFQSSDPQMYGAISRHSSSNTHDRCRSHQEKRWCIHAFDTHICKRLAKPCVVGSYLH